MKPSIHKYNVCNCGSRKRENAMRCRRCFEMTPEHRFRRSYEKTESCWNWTKRTIFGYGYFSLNGKSIRAHRYSYQLHKGKIPEGLCVCHSCDNRRCVNPSHLWLGTLNDNIQDCKRKGRLNRPKHERHSQAKLSMVLANQIRLLYRKGNISHFSLAKKFGVGPTAIKRIVAGHTWVVANG
jgi:hypothetical protein